ncbi:DUF6520 family protein [Pedobacter frigoris]|uniref:DUF6520 family protein n=1 Tax=Pedobacter frigoris TaxID=2571272 RepID=UPI00292D6F03|nr:DUF6520 family protein [Pedobacter frigoris]
MKHLKLSLAAVAFLLATGTAFVSHGITAGWYEPSYPQDQTASPAPPSQCTGNKALCSTQYDANVNVLATRRFQ